MRNINPLYITEIAIHDFKGEECDASILYHEKQSGKQFSRTVSWLSVNKADWLLAAVITLYKTQIPN
jgi:hypothetical protein